jgi:F-type H+-transporting ATPase subunit b
VKRLRGIVIAFAFAFAFAVAATPVVAQAAEEHGSAHEAAAATHARAAAGEHDESYGPAAGEGHEGEGHGAGHGEGHAAPELDVKRLGFQLLNFAVLVFLLVKFGGPAVKKALEARSNQIKSDLASAADARTAAQERFEKQEKRLAALEQEIATITAGIKQEAEAEKARLIAAAEDRARRIQEESAFIIEQQIKQAEEDLRREVAAAAVALAEKIVRNQLGPSDQQRLIDTFVGDVASGNGHHAGTPHTGGSPAPAGRGAPRSEI